MAPRAEVHVFPDIEVFENPPHYQDIFTEDYYITVDALTRCPLHGSLSYGDSNFFLEWGKDSCGERIFRITKDDECAIIVDDGAYDVLYWDLALITDQVNMFVSSPDDWVGQSICGKQAETCFVKDNLDLSVAFKTYYTSSGDELMLTIDEFLKFLEFIWIIQFRDKM